MTRKFALVLWSKIFLVLFLAWSPPAAFAAEPREKIAQTTRVPAPLDRPSPIPPTATSPEEPATTDYAARLDAAKQSLDQIDALLASELLTDADLAREAAAIDPVSKQILVGSCGSHAPAGGAQDPARPAWLGRPIQKPIRPRRLRIRASPRTATTSRSSIRRAKTCLNAPISCKCAPINWRRRSWTGGAPCSPMRCSRADRAFCA